MSNGRPGSVHKEEGETTLEKIKVARERLSVTVEDLQFDLNNRSLEEKDAANEMYVLGQISTLEDIVDFLDELIDEGDEKNGSRLECGTRKV